MSAACEETHSPNEYGQCDDCRVWLKETKFLATVDYDPTRLRRKSNASDESEVMGSIDTALMESTMTSHISVDALPKSLGLFIEMSTGHVTESTMQLLADDGAHCNAWSNEFGAFVSTAILNFDNDYNTQLRSELPDDLTAVLTYAKAQGARYVLLDRDADQIEALPFYEW